jgi:hypothetical protein
MAMNPFLAAIVSSTLLVASPLDGLGDEDSPAPVQAFSAAAGILGAATGCDEIAHDQVVATARQVGVLAEAKASDVAELGAIVRLLMVSAAAGRQALTEGKTDCMTVRASFDNLSRAVLQTEIAFRRQ